MKRSLCKLMTFTLILGCISLVQAQDGQGPEQLRAFQEEGHQMRMQHIERMYELKKSQLEKSVVEQRQMAQQIYELEQQIQPGQQERNRELRQQIRELKKGLMQSRKEGHKEIREQQKEFRGQMKQRRERLKNEFSLDEEGPKRGRRARQRNNE